MPADFTTNNPRGIGYQQGLFSGTPGQAIDMNFFNAAFAGRLNSNKIYKAAYHCNIVEYSGLSQWLDEWANASSSCYPEYSLIETYGDYQQIKLSAGATIPASNAGTVALHLNANSSFVSKQFILPQVGNVLVAPPNGTLLVVTAINQASSNDITVTVKQVDTTGNTGGFTLASGDELLVLSGADIADCACPTGQFALPDMPVITDLRMIHFGDKGEVCGDAIDKCQWLKIELTDENGKIVDHWYTEALKKMYQRFEKSRFYKRLFDPNFGLIPILKARGIKWVPASNSAITITDIRQWVKELDQAGIGCHEFAIFAGGDLYSQFQTFFNTLGIAQLLYAERPLNDCAWINMEYCGIKVEGLTLHVYKEPLFSNGKELGSQNMVFPMSAVIVPLCARPNFTRRSSLTTPDTFDDMGPKMLEVVYFKSQADGSVWENKTDSNGLFGPRNTFGTGCRKHEWTIETRFLQEIHCADWWGYMGL